MMSVTMSLLLDGEIFEQTLRVPAHVAEEMQRLPLSKKVPGSIPQPFYLITVCSQGWLRD